MIPIKYNDARTITESYAKVLESETPMEFKNLGVYWHGGGYDGCTWEPNFGYFDAEGGWHPSFVTGSNVWKTADGAISNIEANRSYEEIETFPMNTPQEVNEMIHKLQDKVMASFVVRFADALLKDGYDVKMKCTKCKSDFDPGDYESFANCMPEGYAHGIGGIAIGNDEVWCPDCHSSSQCLACGEETLEDSESINDTLVKAIFDNFEGHVCENCIDSFLKDNPEIRDVWDEIEVMNGNLSEQVRKYRENLLSSGMTEDDVKAVIDRQLKQPTAYIDSEKAKVMEMVNDAAPKNWY